MPGEILLAEVKCHILPCSVSQIRQTIRNLFQQSLRLPFSSTQLHKMAVKQLNEINE